MEISQGNFLYSYLYFKQAKMSCFSFYLFYQIGEQEGRKGAAQEGRAGTNRREMVAGKGIGG
jgi:hypothetical protein